MVVCCINTPWRPSLSYTVVLQTVSSKFGSVKLEAVQSLQRLKPDTTVLGPLASLTLLWPKSSKRPSSTAKGDVLDVQKAHTGVMFRCLVRDR